MTDTIRVASLRRFALLASGEAAVVEAAEASGMGRLAEDELDPWIASTVGTGELIAAAAAAGAREVIVAAGGTATVDGGMGALHALEAAARLPRRITVACDARAAWESAAPMFAPQKGAGPATVKRLASRLSEIAGRLPRDPRGERFTGCGGGLSGALWSVHGAQLVSGAALVLDAIGFDAAMRGARLVVTGEGRLDEQTLQGKAAGEVATRCRQAGVGCHAVVGQARMELFQERILDLQSVTEATTLEELERAGEALAP